VSIQVAILKVLASHGNGRATLASLKRDIVILTASGGDWGARLKRLAGRVASIDIFGSGYVFRDHDGWEITTEGRDFLCALEAVTQDNRPAEIELPVRPKLPDIRPVNSLWLVIGSSAGVGAARQRRSRFRAKAQRARKLPQNKSRRPAKPRIKAA